MKLYLLNQFQRLIKFKSRRSVIPMKFEQQRATSLRNVNLKLPSTALSVIPASPVSIHKLRNSKISYELGAAVLLIIVTLTVVLKKVDELSEPPPIISLIDDQRSVRPKRPAPKLAVLSDVHLVLARLSLLGGGRFGYWRQRKSGYIARSPYYGFGEKSATNARRNTLTIYALSDSSAYIRTLKIVLTVNNATQKMQALKRYAVTVKGVFSMIGLPMAVELQKAISQGRSFNRNDKVGVVISEVHTNKIDWYRLAITPQ